MYRRGLLRMNELKKRMNKIKEVINQYIINM